MTDETPVTSDSPIARESARSLVLMAITLAVIGVVTYQVWLRLNTRSNVRLTADKIQAKPEPPSWIKSNLVQEVIIQGSLGNHSLAEPGLVRVVHRAFTNHTWVKKVNYAAIESTGKIAVELDYRRPFAALSVRNEQVPVEGDAEQGLLAVDDEGVCLPDITEAELNQLPRIYADNASAPQHYGEPWHDKRIRQSVDIIAALGNAWQALELYSVNAPESPRVATSQEVPVFELLNKQKYRIIWGSAVGSELASEPLAAQKVAYLVDKASQLPTATPGANDQILVDLRNLQLSPPELSADRAKADQRTGR
ncbi:MAG: hypothetical protein O2931_02150 [Planctomycetota bacterium]|nr:hypothetical protein [Planctomycetota bacterium]MDA1177576.1 hypothetical protein [Planctomycetota bacterium]